MAFGGFEDFEAFEAYDPYDFAGEADDNCYNSDCNSSDLDPSGGADMSEYDDEPQWYDGADGDYDCQGQYDDDPNPYHGDYSDE